MSIDVDDDDNFGKSLIGTTIGGRYKVRRILGQGGMGVVVEARQEDLDQKVAIKLMRPALAGEGPLVTRFFREARLSARLNSPHIVRVFDSGRLPSGAPFLVMELLKGHDLGEELDKRGGPLSIEEATDYLLQTALGLAELHGLRVVHRDLKPSNLFLSEDAGTRTLRLLDFGISKDTTSKATNANLTSTQHLLGTAQFMSPEQIKESKSVDARSDIWSLGVIAYQLYTGELPFMSDSGAAGELFGLILFTDPRKPTAIRPDLPQALEDAIMKCLQRDAAARFADIADFADALAPFAAPENRARAAAVRQRLVARSQQAPESEDVGTAPTDPPPPSQEARALGPMSAPLSGAKTQQEQGMVRLAGAPPPPVTTPSASHTAVPVTSDSVAPKKTRSLAMPIGIAIGALALASIVTVVVAGMKGKPAEPDTSASSPPPSLSDVPATVTTITPSTATATTTPTAASTAGAATSSSSAPAPKRPPITQTTAAKKPPTAPSAKPGQDTLIQDRN
jgi:serine/threonine-protein kinase